MSDGDALLRAILEHPAEDTPRLMYADWLQERGQEQWAQFIRATRANWHYVYFLHNELARSIPTATFSGYGREEEGPLGFGLPRWSFSFPFPERFAFGRAIWDRGFVSHLVVPLSAFMRHAEALFRAHPIERVTLTDKEPWHETESDSWLWTIGTDADGLSALPKVLWRHLPMPSPYGPSRYHTRPEAESALSRACVAYGRSLAGLAPVPN